MSTLILTFLLFYNSQDSWELKKDKNDIQVYTRESGNTPIKSFKGVTKIDSTPEQVLKVIRDLQKYPLWMDRCESGEIIEVISNSEYYIHTKMTMPFPVKDRDVVQLIKVEHRESEIYIDIISTPDYIKAEDGYVRIPLSEGYWKLTPTGTKTTRIELVSTNDPGGSIPDWVVNMMIVGTPYSMMENLQHYVPDNK